MASSRSAASASSTGVSRVPVALKLATTGRRRERRGRSRRGRDLGGQRADADAHAVADRDDARDPAAQVVQRRVGRRLAGERDVPGLDDDADRAACRVARADARSVLEDDLREAVAAPARAMPRRRFPPASSATKAFAGARSAPPRVPVWTIRPSTRTPMRSASAAASAKSCVTRSVGRPSSRRSRLELAADLPARVRVEGRHRLVEQQHLEALRASARARATRWRSPPESSPGLRLGELRDPEALQEIRPRVARRRRRCARRTGAGRARTPGTRSRPSARSGGGRRAPSSQVSPSDLDRAASGPAQPGDGPRERSSCPRPRARPARPSPPDLERYFDVEGANRAVRSSRSVSMCKTLRATRIAAPTRTNSALIASATSKSWSSSA